MDPESICAAFSRGLSRPVRYVETPIEIEVPIPKGYREQLDALQSLFGGAKADGKGAPYWWRGLFDDDAGASGTPAKRPRKKDKAGPKKKGEKTKQPPPEDEDDIEADDEAELDSDEAEVLRAPRKLWAGWRDVEGYAREVFPVEEKLNHRTWMEDESDDNDSGEDDDESKISEVSKESQENTETEE